MSDDNLKTLGIVIDALKNLSEIQGPTPQQILSFLNTEYNIPKEKIRRQLGSILKRCKEFGILKKTCGHQKANPKKVMIITGKRPCCKCKDCTGDCGYCKPTDKSCERSGDKPKQKMCRSDKPKRSKCKRRSKSSKRSRSRKRDGCKTKRSMMKKKKRKRDGCKPKKKRDACKSRRKRRAPKKC